MGLSSAEAIEASDGSTDVSRAAVRFLSAGGASTVVKLLTVFGA
jgi:hypothetical protein